MSVELVVFDWYRTLACPHPDDFWTRLPEIIESDGGQASAQALAEWEALPLAHEDHSRTEAAYRSWQDQRLLSLLEACRVPEPRRSQRAAELTTIRYEREFCLFREAASVLHVLRARGLRLGVCSNWDWDLDRQLRANGIEALFDVVACSASIGFRKPHPRVFNALAERTGVAPGSILFVGDSWSDDVIGAIDAGLRGIHVARTPCNVSEHGTVPCVSDLGSVTQVIDRLCSP